MDKTKKTVWTKLTVPLKNDDINKTTHYHRSHEFIKTYYEQPYHLCQMCDITCDIIHEININDDIASICDKCIYIYEKLYSKIFSVMTFYEIRQYITLKQTSKYNKYKGESDFIVKNLKEKYNNRLITTLIRDGASFICDMCCLDYSDKPYVLQNKNINTVDSQLCKYCIKNFNNYYHDFFTVMTLYEIDEFCKEYQKIINISLHYDCEQFALELFNELETPYKDRLFMSSPRMSWVALCLSQGFINDAV